MNIPVYYEKQFYLSQTKRNASTPGEFHSILIYVCFFFFLLKKVNMFYFLKC